MTLAIRLRISWREQCSGRMLDCHAKGSRIESSFRIYSFALQLCKLFCISQKTVLETRKPQEFQGFFR